MKKYYITGYDEDYPEICTWVKSKFPNIDITVLPFNIENPLGSCRVHIEDVFVLSKSTSIVPIDSRGYIDREVFYLNSRHSFCPLNVKDLHSAILAIL